MCVWRGRLPTRAPVAWRIVWLGLPQSSVLTLASSPDPRLLPCSSQAFRKSVGFPKMGQVLGAKITPVGDEVELMVVFANRSQNVGKDREPETVIFKNTEDQIGLDALPGKAVQLRAHDESYQDHYATRTKSSVIDQSAPVVLVVKVDAPVLFTQSMKLSNGRTVHKDMVGYVGSFASRGVPAPADSALVINTTVCRAETRVLTCVQPGRVCRYHVTMAGTSTTATLSRAWPARWSTSSPRTSSIFGSHSQTGRKRR